MTENNPEENSKLYYSIGEVAKHFGVNVSLIRFWSNEFSAWIKPHTNKKGNRFYTASDIATLQQIHKLLKEQGFTLSGAKEQLSSKSDLQISKPDLLKTLHELRNYLQSLSENIDKITK